MKYNIDIPDGNIYENKLWIYYNLFGWIYMKWKYIIFIYYVFLIWAIVIEY